MVNFNLNLPIVSQDYEIKYKLIHLGINSEKMKKKTLLFYDYYLILDNITFYACIHFYYITVMDANLIK